MHQAPERPLGEALDLVVSQIERLQTDQLQEAVVRQNTDRVVLQVHVVDLLDAGEGAGVD
jgi:serine/threonine protein kinase HipA of HipAB toxin-antitoxin module